MYKLENSITINEKTISSPNLCEYFTEDDLTCIGELCIDRYKRDKQSREKWERWNEAGMKLAMQAQENKTFPWPNCANISFPLVTIAAMQFHARAYPALVNGRNPVQCQVYGEDPEGMAKDRAVLQASFMNFQLLEQDTGWEEDTDRGLLNVSIVGCGFKKSRWGASKGHPISEFVPASNFVLDYWARSVEECDTKTHVYPLYRNSIHSNVRRGIYRDILDAEWFCQGGVPSKLENPDGPDQRKGMTRPDNDYDTPFSILEQHTHLDLDGDGYAEPVIVTLEENSQCVLRIVLRFERIEDIEFNKQKEIVSISPTEYFTKIPFIPSPDGGIYDVGFGRLLGPLNDSVNSALNQLYDAGTLANTAGGFLGRGAKLRGGVYSFRPFEWNRVDATGDDLRKSIFPLPVREPSAVMFNLLSLLIDYTNRVSGTTDMQVGENPGQNTPAETSRTMTTQGQKIYSAIYKRIWRSMKGEFKKIYDLNARYLPTRVSFGEGQTITREAFSAGGTNVRPAADPLVVSDEARMAQAAAVRAAAQGNPAYDADAVEEMFLQALGVTDVKRLYKGVENAPTPAPDPKIQVEQIRSQDKAADRQLQMQELMLTLQEQNRLNTAKIAELMAKATSMETDAELQRGNLNITAFRAGLEYIRDSNKSFENQMQAMREMFDVGDLGIGSTESPQSGIGGMAGSPSDAIVSGVGQNSEGGTEGTMG